MNSPTSGVSCDLRSLARLLLLSSAMSIPVAGVSAPQVEIPGFYIETIGLTPEEVAEDTYTEDGYFVGLQTASAMAFAEKTDVVFVVEKFGLVRVIIDGELQRRPVVDMESQVSNYIDSGMGGIDVHPDFPEVKEILITYTHHNGVTPVEGGSKYARVARLEIREEQDADGKLAYYADPPTADNIIVGKLSSSKQFPSCNDRPLGADCGAVDEAAHSFTFVKYGPDGKIYVGTGDGAGYFSPEPHALYAQVNSHLSGKILRVNPDGSGPEDNPFFTGNKWDNASKVYAKGFRNPKSGSFNPETGQFCVGNVGWYTNEGIYCVDPGENAGWPCRENGPVFTGYQTLSLKRDGMTLAACPLQPGTYVEPDYSYAHQLRKIPGEDTPIPVGAVIGCTPALSEEYPESFRGTCFFGDYVFDTLESVRIGQGGGNPSASLIVSGAGLPTDVVNDRNGRVCYLAYNTGIVDGRPVSEVRCIGYDSEGTVPQFPVPSFTSLSDPDSQGTIRFDASASYHTGGEALAFSWDFGDGSIGDSVITEHKYADPGDYRVTLTVSTTGQNVSRTTFQIVRVEDPNFVTPVVPVVTGVTFRAQEHTFSAPVRFDVALRNDKGSDPFRILANIYDADGAEVAHLVKDDLIQLDPGETTSVAFQWDSASELGEHSIWIEFYSQDWESWTLKYANTGDFFVRNRVSGSELDPDSGSTDGESTDGESTDGESTDGESTDGESTDGESTDGESTDGESTDGESTDGESTDGESTDGESTDGESTDGESTAGSVSGDDPTAASGNKEDDDNIFGCTIGSTGANDPLLVLMMLVSAGFALRRRRREPTALAAGNVIAN